MSESSAVNNAFCCTVAYPQFEKWSKLQILAVIAGSILITIGIALKAYRGVNTTLVGSLLSTGILVVILDLFLARRKEDAEANMNPRRKSLSPSDLIISDAIKIAGSPYDLLAKAIDQGTVADVVNVIRENYKNIPDLLTQSYEGKTPLQRALDHFEAKATLTNCYKICVLHAAGAPEDSGILKGLNPFSRVCKGIFEKANGAENITLTEEQRVLVYRFLPVGEA